MPKKSAANSGLSTKIKLAQKFMTAAAAEQMTNNQKQQANSFEKILEAKMVRVL
jgi:hypothetical protein